MRNTLAAAVLSLSALPLLAAGPAPDSDWNQWRGPNRDGHSADTGLLKEWPAGGPPLAWKIADLGTGLSSVSVSGDRIYTMGDQEGTCSIVALNLSDGKTLWRAKVGKPDGGDGYPGPRCTPSSDGKVVVAVGQFGDLVCVDSNDGKELWRKNMIADFGGKLPHWGFADSPLIDGENVICIPGGPKGTVVALKKATGDLVWQSAEVRDDAAYTSIVPTEISGKKQYMVLTFETLAGLDPASGKVLWKTARKGKVAVIPDPIQKDGFVFTTSGYKVGCNVFKLNGSGADEVYSDEKAGVNDKNRTANHHGGMVLVGEHLYGTNEHSLRCVELKTGKLIWENRCVGKGAVTFADGNLIVRSQDGKGSVALVEASPEGYKEHGRFDQPERSKKNSWPHPVVSGGKLYLRDQDVLLCYDVKAK
ncbi:MAG: PQQ-like beta-propeller repeat protein [Planctomycetaceae bacterium]|nr:PQQ-like beta-propeller repeat protein [Planctomycetaceae bacterium]